MLVSRMPSYLLLSCSAVLLGSEVIESLGSELTSRLDRLLAGVTGSLTSEVVDAVGSSSLLALYIEFRKYLIYTV